MTTREKILDALPERIKSKYSGETMIMYAVLFISNVALGIDAEEFDSFRESYLNSSVDSAKGLKCELPFDVDKVTELVKISKKIFGEDNEWYLSSAPEGFMLDIRNPEFGMALKFTTKDSMPVREAPVEIEKMGVGSATVMAPGATYVIRNDTFAGHDVLDLKLVTVDVPEQIIEIVSVSIE